MLFNLRQKTSKLKVCQINETNASLIFNNAHSEL